jgi:hydroxymethylpyrimidine/phosphomethylpyrimidine kinase
VRRIQGLDLAIVAEQIELLLENFPVRAIKTGLLFSAEIVSAVARILRGQKIPLVIDPVMVATSGDLLLKRDAIGVYERELFPLADLVTPNLDEAATLLGESIPNLAAMRDAGRKLYDRYGVPILIKGGHLDQERAVDLLCTADRVEEFSATFERGVQTHGTGCTYSAAITAGLALGLPLGKAIEQAKRFVTRAIAQHFSWPSPGGGSGHALNHSPNDDREN